MSSTPFMPLWISDFLGKTVDLDAAESGAYLLLLMAQWNMGGTLPNDQKKLQRIARCGRNWPKVWAAISHYFDEDENGLFNPKGRDVYKNATSKRAVNSQNGALGGRAKALKNKDTGVANATISLERKATIPEPEPERIGGGGLREPEKIETFREKILAAMGVDPVSGLTGHGSRQLGTQADMVEAGRWLQMPLMTENVVLSEIRQIIQKKHDGPPRGFGYFSPAMQRISAVLSAPPLEPTQNSIHQKAEGFSKNERNSQGNAAILDFARRVGAGEFSFPASDIDPFAPRD